MPPARPPASASQGWPAFRANAGISRGVG
jgi:hypothetical protein